MNKPDDKHTNDKDSSNTIPDNLLSITSLIDELANIYHGLESTINKYTDIQNDEYIIYDTKTKQSLISLSAKQIIPLKTAAISMLAVSLLHKYEPQHVAIYGTGKQAQAHIKALLALYPNIIIDVISKTPSKSLQFAQDYGDRRVRCTRIVFPEVDLVITATNSQRPVYSLQAETQRLVIGIGAQDQNHIEIGRNTIQKSTIYTDDVNSAKLNGGDLIKAEIDWNNVRDLLHLSQSAPHDGPIIFKNMGAKIWDQAIINYLIKQQLLSD